MVNFRLALAIALSYGNNLYLPTGYYDECLFFSNVLYDGHSGGPVFDLSDNKVVGIINGNLTYNNPDSHASAINNERFNLINYLRTGAIL